MRNFFYVTIVLLVAGAAGILYAEQKEQEAAEQAVVKQATAVEAQAESGVATTNVVKQKRSKSALTGKAASTNAPPRDSIITADRIEFDNKEGVILFDNNVLVDDAQFVMRSEQLLVFTDGTNDIHQIMAIGSVNLTNENRSAVCDKAVYTRKDGQIVMTGNVKLLQHDKDTAAIEGNKITIWVDDERMLVEPGRLVLPPGMMDKGSRNFLP